MLKEILDYRKVQKAMKQVISNHGAGGIDGMQTDELRNYLEANWPLLKQSVLEGSYRPQPVRRVPIVKSQGGTRMLGIPTVLNRLFNKPHLNGPALSMSRNSRNTAMDLEQGTLHIRQYISQKTS